MKHEWKPIGRVIKETYGKTPSDAQAAIIAELLSVVDAWKRGELSDLNEAETLGFDSYIRREAIKFLIGDPRLKDLLDFMDEIDLYRAKGRGNGAIRTQQGFWLDQETIRQHEGVASYDTQGNIVSVTFPADMENGICVWPSEWRERQALAPRIRTHGQPRDDDRRERTVSEYQDQWLTPDATT